MIPVELRFEDGTSKQYLIPQSFEELTEEQFVKAIVIMKRSETNPSDQWLLLMLLMKISLKDLKTLNEVQCVELLSSMQFLYDAEKLPSKQIIKKLYGQHSRLARIALYGPGDVLKHLTFGEFLAAETKLDRFTQTSNVSELDQFCGILYRRSNPDRKEYSDRRVGFDGGLLEANGKYFAGVEVGIKTALVVNYTGMKRRFPSMYQNVFPPALQDEEDDEQQVKPKPRKSSSMAWLNTLVSLAGRDVTKVKDIEQSPLHTVLKVLDDLIQHNQEMKNEAMRNRR
jgi:hypothetical protein